MKQDGSVFGGGGWLVSVLYSFSDIVNTYLLRATSVRCDGAVRLVGRWLCSIGKFGSYIAYLISHGSSSQVLRFVL